MMGTKIFKIDASRAENFDENAIGPNGLNCKSNASNAFCIFVRLDIPSKISQNIYSKCVNRMLVLLVIIR